MHTAIPNGKTIKIIWIPSHHTGIARNEADNEARKALYENTTNIKMPTNDYKTLINQEAKKD